MIRKMIIVSSIGLMALSCTKYNYLDGGTAKGDHDCTMWEYMESQPYDWDSTMVMIEHAGLKQYFDGTNGQITFFGVTNHVIRRHILDHNSRIDDGTETGAKWSKVTDIPKEDCKKYLQQLIVPSKALMSGDIPRGNRVIVVLNDGTTGYQDVGGITLDALYGKLFSYTYRGPYQGVPESGPIELYIISRNKTNAEKQMIVSSNIRTKTGVVHALSYTFNFTNL